MAHVEEVITPRLVNQGEKYKGGKIEGCGSWKSDWRLNVAKGFDLFELRAGLRRKGIRRHGSDALDSE